MVRKVKHTDVLFVITLLLCLLLHFFFVFLVPYSEDESFYVTIPFRILNGDSLVQQEWHLTQFSSLFTVLPVYIWTAIKGSVDGIFIFLRCLFLLFHTTLAITIYRFFRKYGVWAIMASMIFYVQIPYRIQAISYQSVFVAFLLLLTLCLISIYKQKSICFYIFAGISVGCCCVCNPFFCVAYVLYLIACALWTMRYSLIRGIIEFKISHPFKKGQKLTKKQKKEQKQQKEQLFNDLPDIEKYNCFFKKKAVLLVTCGILIVAVIAIIFFFMTGGTIDSIFDNIENLLGSSEYAVAPISILNKFIETLHFFNMANFGMPWILPVLFIALILDEKRKYNTHRFAYLSVSVLWTIVFIIGVMKDIEIYKCAISLPFSVLSFVCYILTENKNKKLFYGMYIPCLVATFFQYLAADTLLAVIGIVLAVGNVAGVFFAMDLWKEMHSDSNKDANSTIGKERNKAFRSVIIIGFCLQILFYGIFYQYDQFPLTGDSVKATTGPYSGLYMTQNQYDKYNKVISDLDFIKDYSAPSNPVLVASYSNWMYLYLERPIATYTTWYRGTIDTAQLISYYKENPEKKPKYVYYETSDLKNANIQILSELFDFTREDLSNGILLTVTNYKF
jgi:hypothetical protein